jgi:hypothetical protein
MRRKNAEAQVALPTELLRLINDYQAGRALLSDEFIGRVRALAPVQVARRPPPTLYHKTDLPLFGEASTADRCDGFLALEAIQQQVREGKLAAQVAMKYLVPVARVSAGDCTRMAAAFVAHHCNTRQAGQLYTAWRNGTRAARERILGEPEVFLKTQRQTRGAMPAAVEQVERDLDVVIAILRRTGKRLPKLCRRLLAGNRNKRSARWKLRAGNSTGWRFARHGTRSRSKWTRATSSRMRVR